MADLLPPVRPHSAPRRRARATALRRPGHVPLSRRFTVAVYERPNSPCWWARCFFAGELGRRRRWSTGVLIDCAGGRRASRHQAEQAALEEAKRRLARQLEGAALDLTLASVGRRMLEQKQADNRRARAIASLRWQLDKHVLPHFGQARDVRELERAELEAFKRKLRSTLSPRSTNNALTALRQLLKHAWRVEGLSGEPPSVANCFCSNESKGRALTKSQVRALLGAIDPRAQEARDFLTFVVNTGLRKSEVLALRWAWVDWEANVLRVPAEFCKGGRAAKIPTPLNRVALELLRRRLKHGPLASGGRVFLQQKHDEARNRAAARAGLGRVRTHDLRHTFGSLAHAAGASLPEVRDLLNHTTLAMVSRYAHSYLPRLQQVVERVRIGGGGSHKEPPSRRATGGRR